MARPPHTTSTLTRLSGSAVAGLIGLVRRTSRTVYEPEDALARLKAEHPIIVAVWHGQFMMTSGFWPSRDVRVAAMVARHGDAEFIGAAMESLGVELIRGAGAGGRRKDRGGLHALRQAVRALQDGASVVMTADVPPGPARRAGMGIVTIARLSGRPIVPVASASSRFFTLDTWSRMTINLPFSKLAYVVGDPVHVSADADEDALEAARAELERSLTVATKRAYALAGADLSRVTPLTLQDPAAPPAEPDLRLKIYRTGMSLLRPLAPLVLKVRERKGKEDPRRRDERLGEASAVRPDGMLAWVHAASVGETNAVLPVIEALTAARPHLNVLSDHRHRHLRGAGATAARTALPAPVRAARCARVRGTLPRSLATRPRRVHRIGDLAVAHPRDVGARHSRWRSSTRACRTAAGADGSATKAWRSRCSTASTWCWRRTSALHSASPRSARAT